MSHARTASAEALDDCSRAIQLDPTHEKAHLRKGYHPSPEIPACVIVACVRVCSLCAFYTF